MGALINALKALKNNITQKKTDIFTTIEKHHSVTNKTLGNADEEIQKIINDLNENKKTVLSLNTQLDSEKNYHQQGERARRYIEDQLRTFGIGGVSTSQISDIPEMFNSFRRKSYRYEKNFLPHELPITGKHVPRKSGTSYDVAEFSFNLSNYTNKYSTIILFLRIEYGNYSGNFSNDCVFVYSRDSNMYGYFINLMDEEFVYSNYDNIKIKSVSLSGQTSNYNKMGDSFFKDIGFVDETPSYSDPSNFPIFRIGGATSSISDYLGSYPPKCYVRSSILLND